MPDLFRVASFVFLFSIYAPIGVRVVSGSSQSQAYTTSELEPQNLDMNYVIALATTDGSKIRWTITGQFSDHTWNRLWNELGVSPERWLEWQAARGGLVAIEELPTISLLAHLDEGGLSLDAVSLQSECGKTIPVVGDPDVRSMLEALSQTAAAAVRGRQTVYVYPSTGESVGEQFSTDTSELKD